MWVEVFGLHAKPSTVGSRRHDVRPAFAVNARRWLKECRTRCGALPVARSIGYFSESDMIIKIINMLLRTAEYSISAPVSTERERLAEEQQQNERRRRRWTGQYYNRTGKLPKEFCFYGFKYPREV